MFHPARFILALLTVSLLTTISQSSVSAKTVVDTRWEKLSYCVNDGFGLANDGKEYARMRMEKHYDDGTYEIQFVHSPCDPSDPNYGQWCPQGWASVSSVPSGSNTATVNTNGSWTLHNVPIGEGGYFAPTSGAFWDLNILPLSTTIEMPAAMVN